MFSILLARTTALPGVTKRSPAGTLGELEKSTQRPETSIYTAFNANGILGRSGQKTTRKLTEEKSTQKRAQDHLREHLEAQQLDRLSSRSGHRLSSGPALIIHRTRPA
jgi:hypothetical protein